MRIGRRSKDAEETTLPDEVDQEEVAPAPPVPPAREREAPAAGPFDVAEVDLEESGHIDLGSILLPPPEGLELRLQVEEQSGQVMSVILLGKEGALELRAFAASRGGGAWEELRPRIIAETERVGGKATEEQGTFGDEIVCLVPVKRPEGETATQASRISGHEGPTWLLRANLMGNPAVKADQAKPWEDVIRSVVVRRGAEAMAPGSALPLKLPPEARRAEPAEATQDLPTAPPESQG